MLSIQPTSKSVKKFCENLTNFANLQELDFRHMVLSYSDLVDILEATHKHKTFQTLRSLY